MSTGNTRNGLTGTSKLSQKRTVLQKKNFIHNHFNITPQQEVLQIPGTKTGKIYDFVLII
jgi:hypothetical protein